MAAKLTREAMRAARALLGLTTQELAAQLGVSPTTINSIEAGASFRPSSEQKILEGLDALGVEITNGNGTGARFRLSHRGRYTALPLKDGSGYFARFMPSGYGPIRDVTGFATEREVYEWIEARRATANAATDAAFRKLSQGADDPILTLLEVNKLFEGVMASDLREGARQDKVAEALRLLRAGAAEEQPFAGASREDYQRIHRLITEALAEGL